MTSVICIDGIDHWVRGLEPDGSSFGVDYDVVYVHCRVGSIRFKRHRAPVRVGIVPKCLECYARHG